MNFDPLSIALDRELFARAHNGLHLFVRDAWPLIDPATFRDNWHIGAICERLTAVSTGEIRRLVINVPPGTGKSSIVSVLWPAWEWSLHPERKWIFASYDASLSRRDGLRMVKVLQSPWYGARWGNLLVESRPSAADFSNRAGGFRFATSVEGRVTGRHGDVQVVDDPIKPKDVGASAAVTRKMLSLVSAWWRETMASRAVDPATLRRVIVMQRLHEDDLAGEMLEQGYDHLCLPMRAERLISCPCKRECTREDTREHNEPLWPDRYPEAVIAKLETIEMGPSVASAQLQQRPTPAKGAIFSKDWFRYWHHLPSQPVPIDDQYPCRDESCAVLPKHGVWLQSWDCTFKDAEGSDFVAGGIWLHVPPNFYLVDQVCERLSFVDTCTAILEMSARYPKAVTKLIENKANGPAVESMLSSKVSGIVLVEPQGGKVARANAVQGLFQAGNVYLPSPAIAPWVPAYREQLARFPKSKHDDQVDQTTQALLRLARSSNTVMVDAMRALREQFSGQVPGRDQVAR